MTRSAPPVVDPQQYGPWAVVAGGSEGVGLAAAEQLALSGLDVVLVARREETLAAAAETVAAHGVQVRTIAADLLDPDALTSVAARTADLDVGLLVLNAGANTYRSPVVDADPEAMRQVVQLNVDVPVQWCRVFGARLRDRGRGGIMTLGSLAGYLGHENISIYAAAKAFTRIFTEGLWLELQPSGVNVLHLVIGLTRTPAMERAGLRLDGAADPWDVAAEGLARLGDGPVHVVETAFPAAVARSGPDRAAIVRGQVDASRGMLGTGQAGAAGHRP